MQALKPLPNLLALPSLITGMSILAFFIPTIRLLINQLNLCLNDSDCRLNAVYHMV